MRPQFRRQIADITGRDDTHKKTRTTDVRERIPGTSKSVARLEQPRQSAALLDQFGTTVKPGGLEILDIDDTFCTAHGGQQLAFWNAHHDERGFASMHIYHVASGTPVATILRPARTPKGTEVRTVVKHVTKHLRKLPAFALAPSPPRAVAGALELGDASTCRTTRACSPKPVTS